MDAPTGAIAASGPNSPPLRIARLSMSFPALKALDNVAFQVAAGEVVSLVGQNGSGKSTLVKVLAGIHEPDPGAVLEHRELRFIHQDLGLVPTLSTIENLEIGSRLRRGGLLPVRGRAERAAAERVLGRFGAGFDVRKPVREIEAAERTVVAIARAMSNWSPPDGVLVLDEPTAALGAEEVGRLFEAVRRVAAEGAGVLFISHRLDEVLGLSDRIVALRDGRVVADVPATEVDHERLVGLIAGRSIAPVAHPDLQLGAPVVLRAEGLVTTALRGVDLTIRQGEILGVSGLLGSGREQLASAVFGATVRRSGTVSVADKDVPSNDPRAGIRSGLAMVPADRLRHGGVMTMSARENLTLPLLGPLRRAFGRLDRGGEHAETSEWVARVEVQPPLPEQPLQLFSGGNQQKVIMAKWLRTKPRVLLLDEPTQGVDVGAKAAIYGLVNQAAAEGAAVLVSSSDVNDLITLCDRVIVLRGGSVAAELSRHELSEARLVSESLEPSVRDPATPTPANEVSMTMTDRPEGRLHKGTATSGSRERLRAALSFRSISAVYIFVALFVLFSLWVPHTFLNSNTWKAMLDDQSITALTAIALVIPLSAGTFNLAIGAQVGLGSILSAWLLSTQGLSIPLTLLLTLVGGALVGTVTGLLIVRARIDSFIATLGVSSVLLALTSWVSDGQQILNLGPTWQKLGTNELLGITYPVYFLLFVAGLVWYVLERTPAGRRVYATGGNVEAARLSGVRTGATIVLALTACGLITGAAGALVSSRLATGDPTIGPGYLLPAFAAAFLGSTQFRGGRYNVWGTVLAVYVLATGVKGLQLAGAPVWIPDLFNGLALLLAVGMAKRQGRAGRSAAIARFLGRERNLNA